MAYQTLWKIFNRDNDFEIKYLYEKLQNQIL